MTKLNEKIIVTPTHQEKDQGILVDFKIRNLTRAQAEKKQEKTRHPIVGLIIKNKRGELLVIEKTQKSHEKRLHGFKSIFFGEHLLSNLHKTNSKNLNLGLLERHVANDLIREELAGFEIKLSDPFPRFMIIAEKNHVDRSHLGFIFEGIITKKPKKLLSDGTEKIYRFEKLSQIIRHKKEFNYWSELILNYLSQNLT